MKNKTLYLRVVGGLGNQLFIYAFARSQALKNLFTVVFDMDTGFVKDNYGRKPMLDRHIKQLPIASRKALLKFYFTKLFPSLGWTLFNSKIVVEADPRALFNLDTGSNNEGRNLFVQGYFQSYKYFDEFKEEIQSEVKLEFLKTELIHKLATQITTLNSVSIHVRRLQYSDLLGLDYYLKAIEFIKIKTENPAFFIFSDDIDWCRANLPKLNSFTFVTHDLSDETADLWLMTQCKHHIIANSSFSWWGAWLSLNKNKIIVAPRETSIGVRDLLYPEDWIII